MKILVFETSLSGHRLEYLHHIYMGGREQYEDNYVFVVPETFIDKRNGLDWPESLNIHFRYISEDEINMIESVKGLIKSSFTNTRLLMRYVNEINPDRIILISLMRFMPWLSFIRVKKNSIRGIIYKIYLYENSRGLRRIINHCIYTLFAHRKCMNKIFILNDDESAKRLNKIYRTSNFIYLPDPVPIIERENVRDIRKELDIKSTDKMYLHFGGLSERKGTLTILDAISMMKKEDLHDKVFVFAGKVYNSIKNIFYEKNKELEKNARILVFDEFCSYEFINNLCKSCDVILIPYFEICQSSGVIGYASFFNKPLIGPSEGFLGHLIRSYKMGEMINVNADNLSKALLHDIHIPQNDYCKTHSVYSFISALLS